VLAQNWRNLAHRLAQNWRNLAQNWRNLAQNWRYSRMVLKFKF
jgi:hypothetical protein